MYVSNGSIILTITNTCTYYQDSLMGISTKVIINDHITNCFKMQMFLANKHDTTNRQFNWLVSRHVGLIFPTGFLLFLFSNPYDLLFHSLVKKKYGTYETSWHIPNGNYNSLKWTWLKSARRPKCEQFQAWLDSGVGVKAVVWLVIIDWLCCWVLTWRRVQDGVVFYEILGLWLCGSRVEYWKKKIFDLNGKRVMLLMSCGEVSDYRHSVDEVSFYPTVTVHPRSWKLCYKMSEPWTFVTLTV